MSAHRTRVRTGTARGGPEEGAVLLIFALLLTGLLLVAALVVDLGALQTDRKSAQTAVDAAATAAVNALDPFAGGDAVAACEAAWSYLHENLQGDELPPAACGTFAGECQPGVAREATAADGRYTITIRQPVLEGDAMLNGQSANAGFDGSECQRIGVEVRGRRTHLLARVGGFEEGSYRVRAVARISVGPGGGELVPLLVLEPRGCPALYTSGQGGIDVLPNGATPGLIVVDSDGSMPGNNAPGCANPNTYTIDAQGNQNGYIRAHPAGSAPGAILSFALSQPSAAKSYDPNDLVTGTPSRLLPRPQPSSKRVTRAPIDWRYNCKPAYADHLGFPVRGCPTTAAPHIDDLAAELGGVGAPPGYQRYPRTATDPVTGLPLHPNDMCASQPSTPAVVLPAGNWWVDCTNLVVSSPLTFTSGNVVFEGSVTVDSSTGSLTINQTASSDSIAFVRSASFVKKAQATVSMDRTFLFIANGAVSLGGGTGTVTWRAPHGGPFEDLALWSEAAVLHDLAGQSNWIVEGTLFAPSATPFRLTGQGGVTQTEAQFIVRRLEVAGQGTVQMTPDPDRVTPVPVRRVLLIR